MGDAQPRGKDARTPISLPVVRKDTTSEDRRSFLAKVASAVFAGVVLSGASVETAAADPATGVAPSTIQEGSPPPPIELSTGTEEDVLIRMQRDLSRALQKPMNQRRWSMVIDTRKCVG